MHFEDLNIAIKHQIKYYSSDKSVTEVLKEINNLTILYQKYLQNKNLLYIKDGHETINSTLLLDEKMYFSKIINELLYYNRCEGFTKEANNKIIVYYTGRPSDKLAFSLSAKYIVDYINKKSTEAILSSYYSSKTQAKDYVSCNVLSIVQSFVHKEKKNV